VTARAARRTLAAIETALTLASAAILFLLMLYVTAEVAMRSLFGHPLAGHLEASQLLIAPAALLALAWVQSQGGHVGMDLIHERLSVRGRALADAIGQAVALAAFAVVAWFSGQAALFAREVVDTTPTAYLPT
jgi:TRAP-type C4-dicarboxylate transport system permease small subunit